MRVESDRGGRIPSESRMSPIKQINKTALDGFRGQRMVESQYREDFQMNIQSIDKIRGKIESMLRVGK